MYECFICFIPTSKVKGKYPVSSKFISKLIAIFKGQRDIHHSHITGKIIGYAHNFCNLRCKENYYTIPVFAHDEFRFDFFLFLKGFRPSVWETTDISIAGKNPTNVNFVIIKNQVKFIDTNKYFQQSLTSLAAGMTNKERENIKNCREFLAETLMYIKDDEVDWILEYLSSGKGTIPYKMITDFDSLDIKPEKDFFDHEKFYSCLKEDNISVEEYENVKKIFNILKLQTLGDLNRIYNFQDTAILCEIFESRLILLQKLFKYNITLKNARVQVHFLDMFID